MTIGIKGNRITLHSLYALNKRFKQWIKIYKLIRVDNDPVMGTSTPVTRVYDVQAIILPAKNTRKFHGTGVGEFSYGGIIDEIRTPIIMKKKSLPDLTTNDYALIRGQRYDFDAVEPTADGESYYILSKQSPAVGI